MSGSSGLAATFPTGKPHVGQNLCASSQTLLHWGQDRMSSPFPRKEPPEAITRSIGRLQVERGRARLVPPAPARSPFRAIDEISRGQGSLSYDALVAKRIGELLVDGGVLSQSQLEQALFAQRKDGRKLGQLLVDLGFVSEIQVTQTLSRQLSVPWVSLYHVDFSRSLLNLVTREISERYCLVPIFVRRVRNQGETLYVAMDDPTNDAALHEVTQAAGLPVKQMIACPSDIRAAIRVYYPNDSPVAAPSPSAPQLSVPKEPSALAPPVAIVASPPRPPPPSRATPSLSVPAAPPADDPPPSAPESQAQEGAAAKTARPRPRMISLTLLDGTTISLPAPKKRGQGERADDAVEPSPTPAVTSREGMSDQLTARDLVSALRAVAHGADASEILGTSPRWEAMFSALLSLMLRKGLIADWEFVDEFRKV